MRLEPESPRRTDEERRYFPDWTDPLAEVREELEADHNSYLAGGYAEEFGYRAQPGSSRGVPVLDGESPEESAEWHCQARATHPGYPIRPRPIAFDDEQSAARTAAILEQKRILAAHQAPLEGEIASRGSFVKVADRPYERERRSPEQRAAAVLTRLLAALTTLRWELPHGRKATAGTSAVSPAASDGSAGIYGRARG